MKTKKLLLGAIIFLLTFNVMMATTSNDKDIIVKEELNEIDKRKVRTPGKQ